ncbi:LON peptidase substrate-binding domain-containing protein [Candidatus Nardonella dryophthoridicola]|uniref:LON peptidase substrate-binding domain-containing protein n=1 Tax=endosymbiont of Metamasius hemipterus TaxID=204627 RepID=A0ABT0TW89_9GAMM|nr:LON peptidase substrate-binding domain-containing protein [Candidatus Nardonella dryophthoridicola]MCM0158267.1 LON peptidase substrate-binding domain-containing protein [endosymbiont of Metamasius hemipterus]
MNKEIKFNLILSYPIIIVSNIIIYPFVTINLLINENILINSLYRSIEINNKIVLLIKNNNIINNLNNIGILVNIIKILKFPNGNIKILIKGINLVKILNCIFNKKYIYGSIEILNYIYDYNINKTIIYKRFILNKFYKYNLFNKIVTNKIINFLSNIKELIKLLNNIIYYSNFKFINKYKLLCELSIKKNLYLLINY